MVVTQIHKRQKVIIDCDPGIDDTVALSLALANSAKLDVRLISLTHGNTGSKACLMNIITLMRVLALESEYRTRASLKPLDVGCPRIAVGADGPLLRAHAQGDDVDDSDGWEPYHGSDGLNGFHSRHPSQATTDLMSLFDPNSPQTPTPTGLNFEPSRSPAYLEILDCLRSSDEGEVTLLAMGPLTNVALAAKHDPLAFSRVRRVISMGAALRVPGNQTPRAEFNIYGDPDAAAFVYNLSSPSQALPGRKPCDITIVPLDITMHHILTEEALNKVVTPLSEAGSPLAVFFKNFLGPTFAKIFEISNYRAMVCNDPLVVDAILRPDLYSYEERVDVRVEPNGLWTRGETVIDSRGRPRWPPGWRGPIRDTDNWLSGDTYNEIDVLASLDVSEKSFAERLLEDIFPNA